MNEIKCAVISHARFDTIRVRYESKTERSFYRIFLMPAFCLTAYAGNRTSDVLLNTLHTTEDIDNIK